MEAFHESMGRREFLSHLFHNLIYTLGFGAIIALFFALVLNKNFFESFIIAQCIGLSICFLVMTGLQALKPDNRIKVFIIVILADLIGIAIGMPLGFAAIGRDLSIILEGNILRWVFLSFLIGLIIIYFFFSRDMIAFKERMIKEERIKRLDMEKKALETNFRLLQAQIEPHFLFNTLSNILSLMDTDLERARSMLKDLMQYLRTTLSKSRRESTTLGDEMDLIRAYLNIFKIRMGDRLRYRIDIPEDIKEVPFPPMLIQPLVENAVRHGLEPEITGGEIGIRAAADGDTLRLEVRDTGAGLYENSNPGMGIANIRERLKSLYGERGRLILEENRPSGVRAIIEVPHGKD